MVLKQHSPRPPHRPPFGRVGYGLASQCLDDDQDLHAARRPWSHGDSFARSAVLVEFHWSVVRCVHILGGVVRRDDDAMTKNDQTKKVLYPYC